MGTPNCELDVSRFPIVLVRERGMLNDRERAEQMDALDDLLKRRGRHALIFDLTNAAPLPQAQRTFVAEHWQMQARLIAQKWACIGVVIKPPMLSGLPTGAFWIKAAQVPAKIFPALEEATPWVRTMLNQPQAGETKTAAALK